MKKVLPILITVWTANFGEITSAISAPTNGSFEAGGFAGWSLKTSQGSSSYQMQSQTAGTASNHSFWEPPTSLNPSYSAIGSSKFALLGTLARGNFAGQRTYHISLSQQFDLNQGDIVTGWSFFFNGDYEAQDSAWVKLLDSNGSLLATPWRENSGSQPDRDFNSIPYQTGTPWTQWSWQAPDSGLYTLSLGMTTSEDNNFASYGGFDHIFVTPFNAPIAVPEPTTTALLIIGAAFAAQLRRRRN
jgi:hypothetical protein